jgi:hypothetical protein
MAHIHINLFIIIGFIGWLLFIGNIIFTFNSRCEEIKIINNIKSDIEIVKDELRKLK